MSAVRGLRLVLALALLCAAIPARSFAAALDSGWGGWTELYRGKGDGHGVYLRGSASIDYRFRSLRGVDDSVITRNPLWQSFSFDIRDDKPKRTLSFHTALRGGTDFSVGGFRAEVLYAYLDFSPTKNSSFLRIGRQLLTRAGSAGFTRFDGVRANLVLWRIGVEAFGGVPLRSRFFARGGSFAVPEGEQPFQTGWGRDWTYGFGIFLAGHRNTQFRFGFQDRFKDGALARRHLTLDASQSFAYRVNLFGNFALDLLQRRFSEVRAGLRLRPLGWLSANVEYEHWEPSFDANSIFSVFNTDPFDKLSGQVVLRPSPVLRAWFGGGLQVMPIAKSRDGTEFKGLKRDSGTQIAGVHLRPFAGTKYDILSVELSERVLQGAAGGKFQVSAAVRATPWNRRIELGLRANIQRYGFDLQPQLAGDYGSLVTELILHPTGWMRFNVQVEHIISPWLKQYTQVTAALDFLLGVRKQAGGDAVGATLAGWQPALLAASQRLKALPGEPIYAGLGGGIGTGGRAQ